MPPARHPTGRHAIRYADPDSAPCPRQSVSPAPASPQAVAAVVAVECGRQDRPVPRAPLPRERARQPAALQPPRPALTAQAVRARLREVAAVVVPAWPPPWLHLRVRVERSPWKSISDHILPRAT